MSQVIIAGDTSGTITLQAPAVSGSTTITLPAATGTMMVSGNMPTFSYYQSSAQTLSSSTFTKLTFTSSNWDTTGGMYASSRFTPTIAGYYQINCSFAIATSANELLIKIYKNGSAFLQLADIPAVGQIAGSGLVYCNGSTDYIEIYGYATVGQNTAATSTVTYFSGVMVRSA